MAIGIIGGTINTGGQADTWDSTGPITLSHAVPAGGNRILCCLLATNMQSATFISDVASASWNSQAATIHQEIAFNSGTNGSAPVLSFMYWKESVLSTTTADISITLNNTANSYAIAAWTMQDVNQTTPIVSGETDVDSRDATAPTGLGITTTATAGNRMLFSMGGHRDGGTRVTPDSNITELADFSGGGGTDNFADISLFLANASAAASTTYDTNYRFTLGESERMVGIMLAFLEDVAGGGGGSDQPAALLGL